jgi:hypothetical protein
MQSALLEEAQLRQLGMAGQGRQTLEEMKNP